MIRIPPGDNVDTAIINSLPNGGCHITQPPDYEEHCTDTRIPVTRPSEEPASTANTVPLLLDTSCRETPPPSYTEQDPNAMATGSDATPMTTIEHVPNSASLLATDHRHDTPPPTYQQALES